MTNYFSLDTMKLEEKTRTLHKLQKKLIKVQQIVVMVSLASWLAGLQGLKDERQTMPRP